MKSKEKLEVVSHYLKEIVYGGSDGIVTTFAVVAGFTAANLSSEIAGGISVITLILFGLANLFADATSMGLGNFLSVRSDKDVYNKQKRDQLQLINSKPEESVKLTKDMFSQYNYNDIETKQLTTLVKKDPEFWSELLLKHRFSINNPEGTNPIITGLVTASSFIIFGAIPVLPYILLGDSDSNFSISILGGITALFLLGVLRWKVTEESIVRAIGETVIVGAVSSSIAYLVGSLF